MSWLTYLGGISNRELTSFQDKFNENAALYPENFKSAVSRILDIHEQCFIHGDGYIHDVVDMPNAEWYMSASHGWSKNGLYELTSITNNEWLIEMFDNLIWCIDNNN